MLNLQRTATTQSAVRAVGVDGALICVRDVLMFSYVSMARLIPVRVGNVDMGSAVGMLSGIAVNGGHIDVPRGIVRNALFSIALQQI
jgi:hypothetical protein